MQLAAMRAVPFFRNLPGESLEALADHLRPIAHESGNVLFTAGELGDTMYFVQSGQLEAVDETRGQTLATLGPGSFVGEIALLLDQPRSATVRVAEAAQLWELSRRDLDELLGGHPLIGVEISRELSRRLLAANRRGAAVAAPQCVAVHGDVRELARALDEAEPGRIAVVTLPGASPPPAIPDSVQLVDGAMLDAAGVAALGAAGVPGRSRLLLLLPRWPSALTDPVLGFSEYVVAMGGDAAWLLQGARRSRVLRCDGSRASLQRVVRWIRGRAIGLALSSGGSKAVAHIGALRVLRELGVVIDALAGASGGAVVGAGIASGLTPDEMLEQLEMLRRTFKLHRFDFNLVPRTALSKGIRLRHMLDTIYRGRTFGDSEMPMWVVAADVETGEEIVIDSGPLADGVRASMSMPVFFNPWLRQGRLLIDGAVVNPLPASVLRDAGIRRIVGVNVAGQDIRLHLGASSRVPNVLQIVARMMNAMEREMLKTQMPLVDVIVRPRVSTGYSLDFGRIPDFVAEGVRAAREAGEALAVLVS